MLTAQLHHLPHNNLKTLPNEQKTSSCATLKSISRFLKSISYCEPKEEGKMQRLLQGKPYPTWNSVTPPKKRRENMIKGIHRTHAEEIILLHKSLY